MFTLRTVPVFKTFTKKPIRFPVRKFCQLNQEFPPYDPQKVEPKWQKRWESQTQKHNNFEKVTCKESSSIDPIQEKDPFYVLSMFPYPSGNLHMGHARVYTISDTVARVHKMKGKNVLHPMGWDSFGLPAENAAIARGIQPADWTVSNIASMRKTLDRLGYQFNWEKEVSTCDPSYYKWTQWLFLQMYSKGLACQKANYVNWDPVDKTVLANEQVDNEGKSWRSGALVQKKLMNQWYLRITDYTESLLHDLDTLKDWPQNVIKMQKEWIGEKSGCDVDFKLVNNPGEPEMNITVFTTRPDTIYGVTYIVLSPENLLLKDIILPDHKEKVDQYIQDTLHKTDQQRSASKDGIFTGREVFHPITGKKVPVFIASYVINSYATGAVMGVPAHDQRDFEFVKQMKLKDGVIEVVQPPEGWKHEQAYTGTGKLINSGEYSGLEQDEAIRKIGEFLQNNKKGKVVTVHNLRDWLISRQRYWGCPIPLIYCDNGCGIVPVPEEQLPVVLPIEGVSFSGEGSPLSKLPSWTQCKCPKCGKDARRETDTMDTFVDSSWYYLRFPEANNNQIPFSKEVLSSWSPVNIYIGGIEHAILHLLYSRFIMKFLHGQGYVPVNEPFQSLKAQGMVHGKTLKDSVNGRFLTEDQVETKKIDGSKEILVCKSTGHPIEVTWEKMSKSKYNGVEPSAAVQLYGADTVRLFLLFKKNKEIEKKTLSYGTDTVRFFLLFKVPMNLVLDWDIEQIQGQARWLRRIWGLVHSFVYYFQLKESGNIRKLTESQSRDVVYELEQLSNQIQKAVNSAVKDLENLEFNTAIAHLMKLSNQMKSTLFPETYPTPAIKEMKECPVIENEIVLNGLLDLLSLMYPMAPHFVLELWELISSVKNIPATPYWPSINVITKTTSKKPLVVQLNGKTLSSLLIDSSITKDQIEKIKEIIFKDEKLNQKIKKGLIQKIIILQKENLIVNFVIPKK